MVEYSAFNRFVPGSNPGQSINKIKKETFCICSVLSSQKKRIEIVKAKYVSQYT